MSSNTDIIKNQLIDINQILKNNIDNVLRFFSFNINKDNNIESNNNYKHFFFENFNKNELIKSLLLKCIINFGKYDEDFMMNIFNDKIINNENKNICINNFLDIFYNELTEKILIYLRKIIFLLEKESIISTILFKNSIYKEPIIDKYIQLYISKIHEKELIKINWANPYLNEKIDLDIILGKKLPLLSNIFEELIHYINLNIR